MLELRSDLMTGADQVQSVNCQLIVRSELLELTCLDLLARMREEAEENPALDVECEMPLEEIPTVTTSYSSRSSSGQSWTDPTTLAPDEYDLRDELHRRITWATEGRRREIAAWLVECIDERGYLSANILDIALELEVEPAEVTEALEAVQTVAPPGVGARDLPECLLLQLREMPDVPEYVRTVVGHCDRALEGGGWPSLCESLGLTEQQSQRALEIIRSRLSPYPGEQFRTNWEHIMPGNPEVTQPDVILTAYGDRVEVALTTSDALNVRVAAAYRRLDDRMRQSNARAEDEATRRARAQVRSARQLIWSLKQRERSLYRITRAIVDQQHEFILEGPSEHRPLTHKRIAEMTGLHESTVSRATAGKLVQMPSGDSVSFSVFFDDALPAKTALRGVLAEESANSPLTDSELQDALQERGFDLARRTVNKYRRAMGIPSSSERRRMYAAA